jgi:hypothetical protein
MPISWSIRHYLIILVLSMGLPLVALLVHSLQSNYEAALQEAVEDIYREAELVSADTRRMLRGAEDFLQALALRPNVARLDSTQCDPVLADIKQLFADYANVGVLDRTGQMVCSAVNAPGRKLPTFGDFSGFWRPKHTTVSTSAPFTSARSATNGSRLSRSPSGTKTVSSTAWSATPLILQPTRYCSPVRTAYPKNLH